ncbi:MAG: HNH endonuclease signature motif containing protein [bacterium]|nr:HNH endonuclease signature motif containing protein [bacterium]
MTISGAARARIRDRAKARCSYCQLPEICVYAPMEIDHIIPIAAGGTDDEANLCYACPLCNGNKHDHSEGYDERTDTYLTLFNPNTQQWSDHFAWDKNRATILGQTPQGQVTVDVLKINQPTAVAFRLLMVELGLYPPDLD